MSLANERIRTTVVIIDDDEEHRELMERSVARAARELGDDLEILTFSDPSVALASLPPDGRTVVLLDYRLETTTGVEWLPDYVQARVGPVLLVTSCGDGRIAAEAFRHGAADYIDKQTAFQDSSFVAKAIRESLRKYRLIETNRDLAERLKRFNRELEIKNDELRRANEAAHAFVEDVAHDFRTPLAVIKEFASIIADGVSGPVNTEQGRHLKYIDTAVDDLAHMVDDFLDSAKLRARLLKVRRCRVNASQIVEHVLPMLERKAEGKQISILVDASPDTPPVFADLSKAARVVVNLAVNAVKFSPKGGDVAIRCGRSECGGCRVTVSDEGPGIAPEDLRLVFERFAQADSRDCERVKGFGLGLSISVELAAMNFGRLEVESELGAGSSFSLVLPPADPEGLTRVYAEWCATHHSGAPLCCFCLEPLGQTSLSDLHEFVCNTSYARDLIFEPDDRRVICMGPTDHADDWIGRLRRVGLSDSGKPIELTVASPEQFRLPDESDRLLSWVREIEQEAPVGS